MRFPALQVPLLVATIATVTPAAVWGQVQFRAPKNFRSQSVEIKMGGLTTTPDSRPQLLLMLSNKTDRTVWLGVHFTPPAPNAGCDEAKRVESKQEVMFACAQDSVIADVDYPLAVTVFTDSALTDTVEASSTQMRFGRKDLIAFGEWAEARKLPKTYENVVLKESLGVRTALFGALSVEHGTLVVKPDSINYSSKKRTVSISAAQVQRVWVRQLPRQSRYRENLWLVVDYDDGGTAKILAFQPSDDRLFDKMMSSLKYLAEQREKKQ